MHRSRLGSDASVYGSDVESNEKPRDWVNKPHTLTIGLLTVFYVLYAAFKDTPVDATTEYNTKRGIKYASIVFLIYCGLQLRDGHFQRPHPGIWRIVTGIFILYEMFLIFLLFQNTKDARSFMTYFDPKLGVKLPSRSYAEDCRLFTFDDPESSIRNLRDTFYDEFVIMHLLGWFVGALMVRSYIVCWAISILFEGYEMTFEHWLPNFKECWWDHIFFDILVCNALGIYLGMKLCHYLEMKNFNWVGIQSKLTLRKRAQRAIEIFTPESWLPYEWAKLRCANRFWRVMFMIIAWSVMLLNSFFLKEILWIPPPNPLNIYRLMIWFSAGSYAIAEYYIFCTTPGVTKLGPRAWLGIGVVITEVCIIIKHGQKVFTAPFPRNVKIVWGIVAFVLIVGSTIYFKFFNQPLCQPHEQKMSRRRLKENRPDSIEESDAKSKSPTRRSNRNRTSVETYKEK